MERGKPVVKKEEDITKLHALQSMLVARNALAASLGLQQYGGDRDIYQALGYKLELVFNDYYARYTRQDIAKAIIDRPVKATWQGPLELVESNEAEDTSFEKAWKALNTDLGIKNVLTRVDRLTGIGRWGVLLLGLDDVQDQGGFIKPVRAGQRKLVYLKPFSENTAKVDTYEIEPTNPRYGMPLTYSVQVANVANGSDSTVKVHHTRVIHIVDGALESEIEGIPRLKGVFNSLMDLEKIVGGSAEMFWRGARPGFQGVLDKDYTMTTALKADLEDQLNEYEHGLRRFLINEGVKLEELKQQMSDPSKNVDTILKMISAETGIPMRVLSGSERGQLASDQDKGEWLTYVQSRREDFAEPKIIRPFVLRLIELKILPKPKEDYTVKWQDLFAISEKDRVETGKARAIALSEYAKNPLAMEVVPPTAFLEFCWGCTTEQITLVNKMREAGLDEEIADFIKSMQPAKAAPADPNKVEKKPKAKVE